MHDSHNIRLSALLVLLASTAGASHAQRQSSPTCDIGAVRQRVAAVDDSLGIALVRADTARLAQLYADDLVSINYRGIRSTKAMLLAAIGSGRLRFDTLQVGDRIIDVHGDSVLLFEKMHQVASAQDGRHPTEIGYRRTYVCREGRWQLVAAVIGADTGAR